MALFASPDWVDQLDRALLAVTIPAIDADAVVVQYLLADGPGDAGPYALELGPDGVRARPGPVEGATVTFRQSYAVAVAIAQGTRAGQSAVLDGDVAVEGDVVRLLPWRPALTAVDAALASLRAETTY